MNDQTTIETVKVPSASMTDEEKARAREAGWVPLADHEALQAELDAANKRAEDAETALEKAKAKPKRVSSRAAEPKARKFGKVKPLVDEEGRDLSVEDRRNALREKLAGAEEIEVAFVDTKGHEIPGSRPVEVSGDVWKDHALGLMLNEPIELRGPVDEAGFAIAGYALVIDGDHVATQFRSEPFNVAPHSHNKLVDDIIF